MCKTLKVSASGYYGWLGRPLSQRQQANVKLTVHIREAFVASDETYGMPRIRAELQDTGIVASRKRIAEVMAALSADEAQQLAALQAPVGLPIGAQTPHEIAVSVLAHLIQVRATNQPL